MFKSFRRGVRALAVVSFLGLSGLLLTAPALAQTEAVPPETTLTHLHVWDVNIEHLRKSTTWDGFIERMKASPTRPDLILVNELRLDNWNGSNGNDIDEFRAKLDQQFGIGFYTFIHSDGSGLEPGGNVIFWNKNRFSYLDVRRWKSFAGTSCSQSDGNAKAQVAVGLFDKLQSKTVTVAAVHWQPGLSMSCIQTNNSTVDAKLEEIRSTRRLSIIGGDFNQRPDERGETIENGLETNPDCWYRVFSGATTHTNSGCGSGPDRYFDTVWLHPDGGAGANPAPATICEQYTFINAIEFPGVESNDAYNGCTDLGGNSNDLDRDRIDYIWIGWETSSGSAYVPLTPEAQSYVSVASADLGVDLGSLTRYSDHRAVEALVEWPPLP